MNVAAVHCAYLSQNPQSSVRTVPHFHILLRCCTVEEGRKEGRAIDGRLFKVTTCPSVRPNLFGQLDCRLPRARGADVYERRAIKAGEAARTRLKRIPIVFSTG